MVIQKSESVMNGFFQAFRMEVLRAIQNSFFPTTYFAILITLFLNIYLYTTTDSYVSVAYLLEYSFIGSLTMLFYVWGCFAAWSFLLCRQTKWFFATNWESMPCQELLHCKMLCGFFDIRLDYGYVDKHFPVAPFLFSPVR